MKLCVSHFAADAVTELHTKIDKAIQTAKIVFDIDFITVNFLMLTPSSCAADILITVCNLTVETVPDSMAVQCINSLIFATESPPDS